MAYVFPYYIIRKSGLSYNDLSHLIADESNLVIKELLEVETTLHSTKNRLLRKLEEKLKIESDLSVKNSLYKLKRSIKKNNYNFSDNFNENIEAFRNEIELYSKLKIKLDSLRQRGELVFEKEHKVLSKVIFRLSRSEALRNGLLLSSLSLLKRSNRYLRENTPTKKKQSTELAIVRYLARICTKTSPFSSFTTLSLGHLNKEYSSGKQCANRPIKNSKIYLNNLLIGHYTRLLIQIPTFCDCLKIRVNPSLIETEDNLMAIIGSYNFELVQNAPSSKSISRLLEIIVKNKAIHRGQLIQKFSKNREQFNSINNFLNSMIDHGFLEYEIFDVGNIKDWHIEFGNFLLELNLGDDLIIGVGNTFRKLNTILLDYEQNQFNERQRIQKDIFESLMSIHYRICEQINDGVQDKKVAFPFNEENILYENVYEDLSMQLDKAEIEVLINKFNFFLEHIYSEGEYPLENKIKHVAKNIDTSKFPMPITYFYDLFLKSKEEKKEITEHSILDYFTEIQADHLSAEIKKEALQKLLSKKKRSIQSYGMLTQVYSENGKYIFVLNSFFHGFGRLYGRYLFDLDEGVTNEIRKWNSMQKENEELYIENSDPSYNAANIHPLLLDKELGVFVL